MVLVDTVQAPRAGAGEPVDHGQSHMEQMLKDHLSKKMDD